MLAFRNPNGPVAVITYNNQGDPKQFNIKVGHLNPNPTLES
ncbi:glycoside hydrolase family 30 beta sandwich domain-containing protein [Elizabethkingia occulta]